jgi:hypothetical protein
VPHRYLTRILAGQVSRLTKYYETVTQLSPLPNDDGSLLRHLDGQVKGVAASVDEIAPVAAGERNVILLNGNLNHDLDIEATLAAIRSRLTRLSRLVVVLYNPYFRGIFWLANRLGLRAGPVPTTFITREAIDALAKLSGYEVVQVRPVGYSPFRLLGLGDAINRALPVVPLLRWLGFAAVVVLRPVVAVVVAPPSLSIVIPCRNEKGNIEAAVKRLPSFPAAVEVIYVEGHSSDGTWQEVQRVVAEYGSRMTVSAYQQTGKGKSDAVRLGFSKARHELVTILDADLTMPPEMLPRFYNAYCSGLADFVNGTRLVYPIEGEAMRFLNRLGNVFFAKALSFVLDSRVNDSLCGTKLLRRDDYARMVRWRGDFGDVDPFGDFELLFPAAILGLGIIDVPVYYRARSYGATNIHRFRHGLMLLRMTLIGLFRVKAGAGPR